MRIITVRVQCAPSDCMILTQYVAHAEKVWQALAKVDEALDPNSGLAKEDFVDDRAITSMARLWDVGKTEPIKVGKASPTEGTLPASVYFICKYLSLAQVRCACR